MGWKKFIFALVVLSMSSTGFAGDADNAMRPPADGKSSPSGAPSYFEGVWVGKWPWGPQGVELTITVGKKRGNGMFGTIYSWEMGQLHSGRPIRPGTLKAWGKEQGDQFLIEWKNKEGSKFSITLTKGQEDSVKAVYDAAGPFQGKTMADMETYLKRKK